MIARQYRLREDSDVRRTRARGKSWPNGPVVARILANSLEPRQNRYTVIAGKRCGKAVQRNRMKRLLREALRGYHPLLRPGHDMALVCRGTVADLPSLEAAQELLLTIFTRSALWKPGVTPPAPGTPITSSWILPSEENPAS
ncbi:MAG: ribonuclease P protein component [Thermomicrobiales bacterium]